MSGLIGVEPLSNNAEVSADLSIERSADGYMLRVNPRFLADTSRLSVTVFARYESGEVAALAMEQAFRSIDRPNPTLTQSLLFPAATIASVLMGAKPDAIGLKFIVSEIEAGGNDLLETSEVDYDFPSPILIEANFDSGESSVPAPGADLSIKVEPLASIFGTESLLLIAEVFNVADGDNSSTVRSQQLSKLPPLRLKQGEANYVLEGEGLRQALKEISLDSGQAIRIKIAVDDNSDGVVSAKAASTSLTYPVSPPIDITIGVSSNEVTEGSSIQFSISVKNAGDSLTTDRFEYVLSGSRIDADDIKGGALTGKFSLDNNGNANISIELSKDNRAEGPELLFFSIKPSNASTSILIQDPDGASFDELNTQSTVLTAGDDVFMGTSEDDVVYGGSGRDSINGGLGSDNLDGENDADLLDGGSGNDTLTGGNGADTLTGGDGEDALDGGNGADSLDGGSGDDIIDGKDGDDTLRGGEGSDFLTAGAGNDLIYITSVGDDGVIDGELGVDTVIYTSGSAGYEFELFGSGNIIVSDVKRSSDLTDSLANIERVVVLDFRDSSVIQARAFDLDGNAGFVAKVLATVFGPDAVNNKVYAGIGLQLLDKDGYRYESLMKLAIEVALGGSFNNPEQVVKLLYENVLGVVPSSEQASPFTQLLVDGQRKGQYSDAVANLGVLAAEFNATSTSNINLVGLTETGLSYLPVPIF